MARKPTGPPRPRFLRSSLLALSLLSLPVLAQEGSLEREPDPAAKPFFVVEPGIAYSIGSDFGAMPQLTLYLELPRSWQIGARARIAVKDAQSAYDYQPQIGLSIGKFWHDNDEELAIRNSEYFTFALGSYFGYDNLGNRLGMQNYAAIALGKYWMPFETQDFGFDLGLELVNLDFGSATKGHMRGHSELVLVNLCVGIFYAIP